MAHQAATPSDSGSASASPADAAASAGRTTGGATSLARGKACLRCRKRKMRCDGAHPACAQCVRAHKADVCAYDDGRGKTRTQALRERIVRLEAELQRLRDGRGDSATGNLGMREDSVFLMDPHAPPPPPSSSASSDSSAFEGLDYIDFGADAFGDMESRVGMDIERPATSLSDPAVPGSAIASEPMSFTSDTEEYELQRNRTIRQSDHQLRAPRERQRPSSGVFGYSANHPLVQQAQGYSSQPQFQFQQGPSGHGHSRTSSTGSPSPSSSTVGSIGGHAGHSVGESPYSGYAEPLPFDFSPFHSPDPSMYAPAVPAFVSSQPAYSSIIDQEIQAGINAETESTLVQFVLAHREQVGLVLHPGRLLAAFSQSPDWQRHPVLKDAVVLMGARLARRVCGTPVVSESLEKALLRRAQAGAGEALKLAALPPSLRPSPSFNQRRIRQEGSVSPPMQGQAQTQGNESYNTPALDVVQSHVLLSRYFFAEGRASEARVHASSAADLALQLGLHQLCALNPEANFERGTMNDSVKGTLQLTPPIDSIALGERIDLFWAVFVLDRTLATALNLPPCIADDECVETRVDTPWPEEMDEYEHVPMESIRGCATLRSFFVHQGLQVAGASSGGFAFPALLAKAAALLVACARTSANWGLHSPASPPPALFMSSSASPSPPPGQGGEDPAVVITRLEACLARFASALLPSHQLGAGLPEGERRKQVTLHTLVHASVVKLHIRLARAGVAVSLEKCVKAARACAALVRTHLGEKDYQVLDPLLGSCWSTLTEVFGLEAVQASAATPGNSASAWVPHDHGALASAGAQLRCAASNSQGFGSVESNPGSV
ncbi:uncharacterized protein FOMMEDRAFT_28322 [Fomitiporia mediterranea MF3/22]|uniref:uncharacterized protein n=1 Tax=Fomitiporia mediterranea (strain MF3/22) TaxID=694068 RepID=UPI000440979A|nr:uncharacterized protein FOMMEDRAFT_28322 [Fomitiporia mediterranea MF3/22]EJD02587.1 hypothetical protein FOMMEDRAFT_28322 [Fomitiporia mediterranea MF3/22]